jgi:hypothetical protein
MVVWRTDYRKPSFTNHLGRISAGTAFWAAPCFLLSPRGAGIVSWRSLYAAPVSDCLAGLISQADVGRPALVRIDSRETETSAIQNAKRRKHARYD